MNTNENKYIQKGLKYFHYLIIPIIIASIIYRQAFMFNMIMFIIVALACLLCALFAFFEKGKFEINVKLNLFDVLLVLLGIIISLFYVVNDIRGHLELDTITW